MPEYYFYYCPAYDGNSHQFLIGLNDDSLPIASESSPHLALGNFALDAITQAEEIKLSFKSTELNLYPSFIDSVRKITEAHNSRLSEKPKKSLFSKFF